MKRDFEVGSSSHPALPYFFSFLGKTTSVAAICFSPSLHFFLRPQTLQTFFKMSLSSAFLHFPSAKKGVGGIRSSLASKWKQGLRERACRKAVYSEGFYLLCLLLFSGNRPQPGKGALQDPAPGPAQPPPVIVSEVPSRARHCLTLLVGSLPKQTVRLLKARSLNLQVFFT